MTFVKKNYPREEVKQFIIDHRDMNYQQMAIEINKRWNCDINRHIVHYLANCIEKTVKNGKYKNNKLVAEFIISNQGKLSYPQMAEEINETFGYDITKGQVANLAKKLGVTEICKSHKVPYPKKKVMELIEKYITNMSYPDMARVINEELGCNISKTIVLNLVKQMGLSNKSLIKRVGWTDEEDTWLINNYKSYKKISNLVTAHNEAGFVLRTYPSIVLRLQKLSLK